MVGTNDPVSEVTDITGGVDTHADTHTVAALDGLGRLLGHATFPATSAGFEELLTWLRCHGNVVAVGMEGTGSYGAGLFQHLRVNGLRIVEVDQPDRRARRKIGKSDPTDAIAAARAVQAGTATGTPKTRDGAVESIRALRVARNGAIKAHTAAINALRQTIITAPAHLRAQLAGLGAKGLVDTSARFRPGDIRDPEQAVKATLRRLARRCQMLAEELAETDKDLKMLLTQKAPELLAVLRRWHRHRRPAHDHGRRQPAAAQVRSIFRGLVRRQPVAGVVRQDQPAQTQPRGRSSRQQRASSRGDRPDEVHPATRTYVERRTAEGMSKREIIRCLKRYVARELLPYIQEAGQDRPDLKLPLIAA